MSKKVLIIKPAVHIDLKNEREIVAAIEKGITDFGIVVLPYYLDYEFGEIDGVVWDTLEKKEEQKPEVESDDILARIESRKMNSKDDNPFNESFINGFNKGLCVAKDIVRAVFAKEKTNEKE